MVRRRQRPAAATLNITPILDIFTVMLIFLIASYSPEEARIKKSAQLELPKSTMSLSHVPKIQVEVTDDYVKVNGREVEGVDPKMDKNLMWMKVREKVKSVSKKENEPILLMADKATTFKHVDRTVAHLAAAGFGEIYFLTERHENLPEGTLITPTEGGAQP